MALDKWRTLYPTSRHTLRSQTLWQRLNTDPGTPAQNRWRMSSQPSHTGGEIKTKNKPVPEYDTKCFYNADTADLTCPPAVTNSQINGEIIESIIVSAYKISPIKSVYIKSKVNCSNRWGGILEGEDNEKVKCAESIMERIKCLSETD